MGGNGPPTQKLEQKQRSSTAHVQVVGSTGLPTNVSSCKMKATSRSLRCNLDRRRCGRSGPGIATTAPAAPIMAHEMHLAEENADTLASKSTAYDDDDECKASTQTPTVLPFTTQFSRCPHTRPRRSRAQLPTSLSFSTCMSLRVRDGNEVAPVKCPPGEGAPWVPESLCTGSKQRDHMR